MEFWVTSVIATATPGTGALFTIAAALARGSRAGVIAALGCALGIVPHLVLALTGAAAVLAASPVAFQVLKWLGVAYLLYIAWGMWRGSGALAAADDPASTGATTARAGAESPWRVIGNAVLVNLLNPKLTLFFFVFLPVFVDPTAPNAVGRMAGLGAVFMGLTFVIFAVYGFGAAWLRRFVIGRPSVMRALDIGFALTFVGLAVMLALTQR